MNYNQWCKLHNISLISVLQQSFESVHEKRSTVLLIRDTDGIFKILKEVYNYKKDLRDYLNEDELYEYLVNHPVPLLPQYYGTVDIDGNKFIKTSFTYGQSLANYCQPDNLLLPNDVSFILGTLILKIELLHKKQILYLDIKPENVLISISNVYIIDLGLTQLKTNDTEQIGIISHPRYAAPETVFNHIVSEKSIVFQLGIIAHELFTGIHPFDTTPFEPRTMDLCECADRHYPTLSKEANVKDEFVIISKMLKLNPVERPTLKTCTEVFTNSYLENQTYRYIKHRGIKSSSDKYVLFPARMGIPHSGHIKYMTRILDLGYKLIISIQRSYTITDRDPIPKWLVMKMVAQSLLELGYSKDDFKFYLTPFYKTEKELRMHFAMMPEKEKLITVASSNPDVHELFSDMEMPIIEQKHLFCTEYDGIPKSWGEIIRNSVKNNDYRTFQDYAAMGVEKILSFAELRIMYGKPNIEFVPGIVKAVLLLNDDPSCFKTLLYSVHVTRYSTPEESLIQAINDTDDICKIIDPYSKNTIVQWNNNIVQFSYNKTEFDGDDEIIYFKQEVV